MGSTMFEHYPQPDDYIPCNRPRPYKDSQITIMTGETSVHSFEIPFDVKTMCEDVEVIYKLGLSVVLTKENENDDLSIDDYDSDTHSSIVSCVLSPSETMLFADTLLDTSVQLRFIMKDIEGKYDAGDIVFSNIYPVTVIDSLLAQAEPTPPVPPIVNNGFGWTED